MVLDLMSRIVALGSEQAAVDATLELLGEVCAPQHLAYVPLVDGSPQSATCRPVDLGATERVAALHGFAGSWEESASGAGFTVSVQHAGERLGVLQVEGLALPEQLSHYLSLALKVVDVLALVIANVRLADRLERARLDARAERERAADLLGLSDSVNKVNATIGSTLDFDDIMRHVVVEAAEATRADAVGLLRREEGGWRLSWGHGYEAGAIGSRFTDEQLPFAMRAATQRDVVWDNDAEKVLSQHPHAVFAPYTRAIMSVPLMLGGEVYGVLSFKSHAPGMFTARQLDFANKLASSLSLALHNARLYETQHTIADTLQQALLVMPRRVRGIEFGHLYKACSREEAAAGGDFYDLFEIDHRTVGVVIGDISGKGLEAAKLTSLVKDSIRAYTHIGTSPAWVIDRTNLLLFEQTDDTVFATAFLGILDTQTGDLLYCNAGHPTPLIRAVDGTVRGLAVGSTVIGAFEEMDAREGLEVLAPGEMLVLYTDGITEARCKDQFFGEQRLVETVSAASVPPGSMPAALLERIEHCNAELPDDVALLCVSLEYRTLHHEPPPEGQLSLTE